jgi:predicted nucleic acid-binding protein
VRITLDSNLLVYATQESDERHEQASDIVARAARADCIQTLQSLGECFHVLKRKRRFSARECRLVVQELRLLFRIVPSIEEDIEEAGRAAAAYGFQFWDAMLWATARRAGCHLILTEDVRGLPDLDGVSFINPFEPKNVRLVTIALRPLERH